MTLCFIVSHHSSDDYSNYLEQWQECTNCNWYLVNIFYFIIKSGISVWFILLLQVIIIRIHTFLNFLNEFKTKLEVVLSTKANSLLYQAAFTGQSLYCSDGINFVWDVKCIAIVLHNILTRMLSITITISIYLLSSSPILLRTWKICFTGKSKSESIA